MKEEEMFPKIIDFLEREGYTILQVNRGKQRGADIIAERSGKKLIIEMKGDTKALSVDLGTAIRQLMRYMKGEAEDYALAVTPSYRRYVESVKYALNQLAVKVFIVSETGVNLFQS